MNTINKILVVRFSSLGDVVLTMPVLTNIKRAMPDAEVVFLTKEKYAPLFFHHPSVDRVIVLGQGQGFLNILRFVRKEQFDVMLDLHRNIRSFILSCLGGFTSVIRYTKDSYARRLTVWFKKSSPSLQIHTIDKYLVPLEKLGIPVKTHSWQLFADTRARAGMKNKKLNILVMQTAFLGDSVLTLPLLDTIKKKFNCKLVVLTTPQGEEVFRAGSVVDEIIVFDKKGSDKGIFSLFRIVRLVRSKQCDIAIVPHRSFKTALIAWLAGIPQRVGFSNSGGKILLNRIVPFNWHEHDIKRNLSLLFPLGVQENSVSWQMKIDTDTQQYADEIIKQEGWESNKEIIGINPGSVWPTKRWLPERFAQISDFFIEKRNAGVMVFGAPADKESADNVVNLGKRKAVNLCGKTSLKQLPAFIKRCSLFITNDSGPMHIAVAMGVPTLAIFGPTTKDLGFFPYGDMHCVMEVELGCRPCGLHGSKQCPKKHFDCMKKITVEAVIKKAEEMLREKKNVHEYTAHC